MALVARDPLETIEVEELTVACDGGGGALGHPKVYLTLVEGKVECGYCGRVYILKPATKVKAEH